MKLSLPNNNRYYKIGNLICYAVILLFTMIAIVRLYPFTAHTMDEILNGPEDDWKWYAKTALDIKHNGFFIPAQSGDYDYPNGFLYNYFLAFCFILFGEDPVPVYIFQSALLGLSISLIYWAFRDKMSAKAGIFFGFLLLAFSFLDINKYYSFRFLSENLAILLFSLFFYCFMRGIEKQKSSLQIISGGILGLLIMTRPNILPVIAVLYVVLLIYVYKRKFELKTFILFSIALVTCASLLAFRNLMVSGNFTFFPANTLTWFKTSLFRPDILLENIWKKFLFCIGYLPSLAPEYHWRPHWTVLALAYFAYLFLKWKKKEKMEIWEGMLNVFILTYFGILVFVIDSNLLMCYGFRYNVVAVLFVLPLVLTPTFFNADAKSN